MFRLYLFFSDMRDNNSDDNDSTIVDMARRIFRTYDRAMLVSLRDACFEMVKCLENEIQDLR